MDLGAYAQIETLEKIAKDNGIECPRLRGYRLMAEESHTELTAENIQDIKYECAEDLCRSDPFWNNNAIAHEYSGWTDALVEYYLDENARNIKWEKIHGWKRKTLKTAIHNRLRPFKKQIDTFNKYVGRADVLYIHARIGGKNWPYYYKNVVNQPWFIEKVDDAYDNTYCDIYAKIK